MSLSVLFPALNNIRLYRFKVLERSLWPRLLRLDLWYKFYFQHSNVLYFIKIFDLNDIWHQDIWQQCHLTTRISRPMRSFRFLMPKLFFIHLMMRNLTTRNLMQKWIFKPFMLRNYLAFLDTTYFKDLNCHKVGGGRAARRRRRKNVACFSKCRKWNFWRLERCCCCWKRILASRREK